MVTCQWVGDSPSSRSRGARKDCRLARIVLEAVASCQLSTLLQNKLAVFGVGGEQTLVICEEDGTAVFVDPVERVQRRVDVGSVQVWGQGGALGSAACRDEGRGRAMDVNMGWK